MPIIQILLKIILNYHYKIILIIEYYYGISYNGKDKKTINKIKNIIQTIKKDINIDKFTYEYEHEEGDIYWIFWHYIEIEKDKPQEIAEVMIKLYELLKKEIK